MIAARVLLLGALTAALAACGPEYDRTEITGVVNKAGGDASSSQISVPEGAIVKAHIVSWNDDKDPLSLVVRSKDPTKLEIRVTVNDRDYAFIGLQQGNTEVEFVADGNVVMTVPAIVTPQTSQ